ncbi:hypothetical protein BHYA_0046g00460 [Botrytis hyacinthi]|uniref:Uncharacterized protein n=1 Tax=Botrytis hyacinthi TaxID=278943 RepID=A0A4Z1GWV6_9HELO|nr:hypothetical protein BHYA_0046g00460 [Botrytis hyacinthi]
MKHTHNHDSEALIVARYHKTNLYTNPNATPTWTGIFDPSFRVLILPRYLGVQTAIVPIPSSRRITSLEYEQEQQKWRERQHEEQSTESESKKNTRERSSPTPSIDSSCSCSYSCTSESSHSTLRTSSSSSDSSHTSISSTTISSTTNSTHMHTHPPNPSTRISEEQSLHNPQLSPKGLASPDPFPKIQDTPTRTSTPKPSLDILSDANTDANTDSDCDDDDDDDYEGVIDEDDDLQPVIKGNEDEDSAICDLMEGIRKMIHPDIFDPATYFGIRYNVNDKQKVPEDQQPRPPIAVLTQHTYPSSAPTDPSQRRKKDKPTLIIRFPNPRT